MPKTIYDKNYKRLIRFVRTRRCEKNLRQEDLSAKMGVARSTIGKIEQCERRLDILEAWRLCRVLDISLSDLESVLNSYGEESDEER